MVLVVFKKLKGQIKKGKTYCIQSSSLTQHVEYLDMKTVLFVSGKSLATSEK